MFLSVKRLPHPIPPADKIFKGDSPFDDGGKLEVIEGFPEGANILFFPETAQEFAPGLDSELKKIIMHIR